MTAFVYSSEGSLGSQVLLPGTAAGSNLGQRRLLSRSQHALALCTVLQASCPMSRGQACQAGKVKSPVKSFAFEYIRTQNICDLTCLVRLFSIHAQSDEVRCTACTIILLPCYIDHLKNELVTEPGPCCICKCHVY